MNVPREGPLLGARIVSARGQLSGRSTATASRLFNTLRPNQRLICALVVPGACCGAQTTTRRSLSGVDPLQSPQALTISPAAEVERVARTAAFAVRVFSLATIATLPYSIVRQPTDRNSGVLSFPIGISSSLCASSNGERDSPSLTSPCWRAPSTGRGYYILSTWRLGSSSLIRRLTDTAFARPCIRPRPRWPRGR